MLDPWIIEEILKKEEERRREERGRAELPLDRSRDSERQPTVTPPREETERGVMIIDI
jgi:hypothetical protein